MGSEMVIVHGGELRASTWVLKDGFGSGRDHRYLVNLIDKYKNDFEDFGVVAVQQQKPNGKSGRPVKEILLNEDQVLFLGSLFRNTPEVVIFKKALVKEFRRLKDELIESASSNADRLETRKAGKETRLIATDTIKTFVDYAKGQGSTKAEMYYANISKMENKAMFLLDQKYPNLRDVLNIHQLLTIKAADLVVMKALSDGMERGLHYRDIYQLAKTRVESFSEIIGKSPVLALELK